jgi:hypothetical protein
MYRLFKGTGKKKPYPSPEQERGKTAKGERQDRAKLRTCHKGCYGSFGDM